MSVGLHWRLLIALQTSYYCRGSRVLEVSIIGAHCILYCLTRHYCCPALGHSSKFHIKYHGQSWRKIFVVYNLVCSCLVLTLPRSEISFWNDFILCVKLTLLCTQHRTTEFEFCCCWERGNKALASVSSLILTITHGSTTRYHWKDWCTFRCLHFKPPIVCLFARAFAIIVSVLSHVDR